MVAVCFFKGKTSAVCGPHLQISAAEKVDQTSAVCKKKTLCFLTSAMLIDMQTRFKTLIKIKKKSIQKLQSSFKVQPNSKH
ncbi:hypothetical protein Hanom_Chr02g00120591 [Helianthus anomalus]